MRLDKFVADNSNLSRREAAWAIRASKVLVNGEICKKASAILTPSQNVTLQGELLSAPTPIYWMLNKPIGVICANSDAAHPTVFDLIDTQLHPAHIGKLQIAGRLDIDTTGLVLITSDGDWNHLITSPNKGLGKRYCVTTADPISDETTAAFAQGVLLHGETKTTLPASLKILDSHHAELEIAEGKYHQVKRMFAAMGNKVVGLHRQSIAHITLDPLLEPGQYRPLSSTEIALK
ncbi:MAG: pseudouridine synthase [Marinagarivorans sp.]|nr:pseudouridine synthase [Marinagarivorans sp.]